MKNMFDLSGKVAIITGASGGLGIQHAKVLAKQGADLAIVARSYDKLVKVSEDIKKMGVRCLPIKCDVSNEEEIKAAVEKTVAEYGKVDILINNAGMTKMSKAEETTKEDWEKVMDVNVTGVFLFSKHVAKYMKENKYGRIINIASIYGKIANEMFPIASYHVSKAGVIHMTKALAVEWAKYGITVNAVAPGLFESEMTQRLMKDERFAKYCKASCPMGHPGKEGDLDGALLLFASEQSSYITGQTIYVDGGVGIV